jgi:DNA-binding transcriptional LysR family regulator
MTTRPHSADLEALIEALIAGGVDLIIVGGAAGVLHGAPVMTQDLDIVHDRSPENVARLLATLEGLDAIIRDPGGRELRPSEADLTSGGQLRLLTRHGPLDVLGALHDGRGYVDLLPHSVVRGDADLQVRVLDLSTLIEVKASTGRARDRITVPVLMALQDETDS